MKNQHPLELAKKMVAGLKLLLSIGNVHFCLMFLLVSFSSSLTAAVPSDFEINHREQRGAVTVIDFNGNYDKDDAQEFNVLPRELVAQEFYKNHTDDYDFLVVFSTFDFDPGDAEAFHHIVKNDIQGIGTPQTDNTQRYGSNGQLKGYTDMALLSKYVTDPYHADFDYVLSTLAHEILHQWSAKISFDQGAGPDRSLIGRDDTHWSNLLDSGASLLYGHKWLDNQDGTFTSTAIRKFFSPLDLYLAGFSEKSEVTPMMLIENDQIDVNVIPTQSIIDYGNTITGNKRTVTIEQIIAAEGPRVPSFEDSQKDFKFAFVLLAEPNQKVPEEQITAIDNISRAFVDRFSSWTGGRATISTFAEPIPTPTGAPGEIQIGNVRPDTAVVADGFSWLRQQQNVDGSWQDKAASQMRDTVVSLDVLRRLDPSFTRENAALDWLALQTANNVDYLSRQAKIEFNLGKVNHAKTLIQSLISYQNEDGGWGIDKNYLSNPVDTVLVLAALIDGRTYANKTYDLAINNAIAYLKRHQNSDGGWSNREDSQSKTYVTTLILNDLKKLNQHLSVEENAINWLASKQNPDGGFSDTSSTLHSTANVIKTFINFKAGDKIQFSNAVDYLLTHQQDNGSWANSRYVTAVVLEALQQFSYPNLFVNPIVNVDIEAPVDGDRVSLNVVISNNSNVVTQASILRLYEGDPTNGGVAIGNDLLVPLLASGTSVELTILWDSLNKQGNNELFLVVDPDDTQLEMSEIDNVTSLQLNVLAAVDGIDVSLTKNSVFASPQSPNKIPENIGFAITLRNQGTQPANNLVVQLRKDAVNGTIIEQKIVNLAGRSTSVVNLTHTLLNSGSTDFYVVLDPDNHINETNESNNFTRIKITTQNSLDLAVSTAGLSVVSESVIQGNDVIFKVNLSNFGTNNSPSFGVRYAIGDGTTSSDIQTSQAQINAGQTIQQEIIWRADKTGALTFNVFIDDGNLLPEINELNNSASLSFSSGTATGANLSVSYTDLNFQPEPALEGSQTTISAVIRNTGTLDATNIQAAFYNGDPNSGGVLIGYVTPITLIAANSEIPVNLSWDSVPTAGEKIIHLVVDPDNTISEFSETDNNAFKSLSVLSLPDLTISPAEIVLNPTFAKEGENITLTVMVNNLGEQTVSQVNVGIYDADPQSGGVLIGTMQSVDVDGGSNISIDFDLGLLTEGRTQFFVSVDANNQVVESDENNNTAMKIVIVQNANFNVSQKYISPNGDLIQDFTELFFRFKIASNPVINIINKQKQVVKEYLDRSMLTDITSGSVQWDGRDESGYIVADGEYYFQIFENAILLAQVTVEIDTNRSSLVDSFGTPSGVFTNLTCKLNEYDGIDYAPDESKIFFTIPIGGGNSLYSPGLYKMGANGQGIKVLLTQSFFDNENIRIPAHNKLILADDGRYVYFEASTLTGTRQRSFWKINANTAEATQINSPYAYGNLIGLDTNAQYMIDFYRGRLLLTSITGSPERSIVDLTQKLGLQEGYLSLDQYELSPNRKHLILNTLHYYESQSYLFYVNLETGMYVTLYQEPMDSQTERAKDSAKVTWRKDGKSFSVFNAVEKTVKIYDDQGTLISDYNLPLLDSSIIERSVNAIEWSPNNDQIAFSYFAGIADPSLSRSQYTKSDKLGGVYKFNVGTGEFQPLHQFGFGESSCNTCEPIMVGPAPFAKQLIWNKQDSILYQSIRYPDGNPTSSNSFNEIWVIDSNNQFLPKQIFNEFIGDLKGSNALYALTELNSSPLNNRLLFRSRAKDLVSSSCSTSVSNDWSYKSLLNLTAELQASRSISSSSIKLSGTATDKNFNNYVLEYATIDAANIWTTIQPSSDISVIDDTFAYWIPPAAGTYLVRLSVYDLAGNKKQKINRVAWSETTAISNLYRTSSYLSPNGDGVKDSTSIFYLVLQPIHLEFDVLDNNGNLVRKFVRDHSALGQEFSITWDGRDELGAYLNDGKYLIQVLDYELEFIIDNTPPQVNLVVNNPYHESVKLDGRLVKMGIPYLQYSLNDDNPDSAVLIKRSVIDQNTHLLNTFSDNVFSGQDSIKVADSIESFSGYDFEIDATDLAGNRTVVVSNVTTEQLVLTQLASNAEKALTPVIFVPLDSDNVENFILVEDNVPARFELHESVIEELIQLDVEFKKVNDTSWQSEPAEVFTIKETYPNNLKSLAEVNHYYYGYWEHSQLELSSEYIFRLSGVNKSGGVYKSNITGIKLTNAKAIRLKDRWFRDMKDGDPVTAIQQLISMSVNPINEGDYVAWGLNGISKPIKHVELFLKSHDDSRYVSEQFAGKFDSPQQAFIFPLRELRTCNTYELRMVATAEDGEIFGHNTSISTKCLDLRVRHIPDYNLDCNLPIKDTAKIEFSTQTAKNIDLKLLTFSRANDPTNILFNINKPTPSGSKKGNPLYTHSYEIDTSLLTEGEINYTVRLVNIEDEEVVVPFTLMIDKTPPNLSINFPLANQKVCKSNLFVDGTISDNNPFRYLLEFSNTTSFDASNNKVFYFKGAENERAFNQLNVKNLESIHQDIPASLSENGNIGSFLYEPDLSGDVAIRLSAFDSAGYRQCSVREFNIDGDVELDSTSLSANAFSPNDDLINDELTVNYSFSEAVEVSLDVYSYSLPQEGTSPGTKIILEELQVNLLTAMPISAGENSMIWYGRNNDGATVADGDYVLRYQITDACGNMIEHYDYVVVDNQKPLIQIDYPNAVDPLSMLIEVRGDIIELESLKYFNQLKYSQIDYGVGDSPTAWINLYKDGKSIKESPVSWNTYGLIGLHQLRITAEDIAGNSNELLVPVNIDNLINIVSYIEGIERLFSPNADNKRDETSIRFGLEQASVLNISIEDDRGNSVTSLLSNQSYNAGAHVINWNGFNSNGVLVSDGNYSVTLLAALSSNTAIKQQETITIELDSVAPQIQIDKPLNGYTSASVGILGSIIDTNLDRYNVFVTNNPIVNVC